MDAIADGRLLDRVQARGSVHVASRSELCDDPGWSRAFAEQRKDHRFYEIVADTIHPEFEHHYFVIKDEVGATLAVQPFFILDQDLIVGMPLWLRRGVDALRRLWPRALKMRTLMVGCVAGEAHIGASNPLAQAQAAEVLATSITAMTRALRASLVVLKEFPTRYRAALRIFTEYGFVRVPSLPMVRLGIEYPSFDRYMAERLSSGTRAKLRRKFRQVERQAPLEMSILSDASAIVHAIYPLYLAVYNRSKLHFEKLTKEFFSALGQRMPDKTRFFVWRQNGKIVGFNLCMIEGDAVFSEYIGLDYSVAFNLHLYYVIARDVITWAMAEGLKSYHSSSLNYDPKYHLRCLLDPIDLYVRHTSSLINPVLRFVLPLMDPTRYDKVLKRFENFADLHGDAAPDGRLAVPDGRTMPPQPAASLAAARPNG